MDDAAGALESVNISIKDMGGNVRPVSDILGELAGKWTTLSDEQRQNLGVTLAGRYQLSRFLALMNNFSLATDATNTAINSQGSSMQEQARYAESLEARINRLDTAWNSFTLSAGEAVLTDGLIVTVETLNDLLTLSSDVIDMMGVLSGVFGTLGVAVFALSTKFRTFVTALAITPASMSATSLATIGLTTAMTRAQVATIGLTTAFRGLLIATGVGAIFAAVGWAVERLISAYSNAKQQQEEFEQSQQANIDAMTSNKQQTEELIAKYKELSTQKESGQWNTENEREYLQLQTQISQVYPALIGHIDATGQAHLKTSEQIDKEIELTKQLIEAKKEETKAKAQDTIKQQIEEQKELQKQIEEARKQQEQWKNYNPLFDKEDAELTKNIESAELESRIKGLEIQISNASLKINDEVLKVAEAFNKLEISPSISKEITNLVSSMDLTDLNAEELEAFAIQLAVLSDNMQKALESGDSDGFNKAKQGMSDLASTMGATKTQLSDFSLSYDKSKESSEQLTNATYESTDALSAYNDEAIEGMSAQDELNKRIQDAKDNFSELSDIILEVVQAKDYDKAVSLMQNEAYNALSDELSPINGLLESMAEGKAISASEAYKLIQAEEELAGAISFENGQVKINEKAVIDLRDAKVRSYKDMQEAVKQEAINTANATIAKLKNYGLEIQGIQNLQDAKKRLADVEEEIGLTSGMSWDAGQRQLHEAKSQITDVVDLYENIDSLSEMASTGLTQVGTSMEDLSKQSEKSKKETENSIYVSDKYKLTIEELNTAIEKLNKLQEEFPNYSSQYQKAIKNEIELLKEKKDLLKEQSADLSKQIRSGNIRQSGIITTSSPSTSVSSTPSYTSTMATGGGTQATIWNFFKSKGFTDGIVAGIMGNLKMESNFNTSATNPSSGAFGLAQWLGGRKSSLRNYAASSGTSMSDLSTQLNFLWKELNGSEKRTLNWIKSNPNASASQMAAMFDKLFERSEGTHIPQRQSYANQIFSQFSGKSVPTSSVVSSPTTSASDASKREAERLQAIDNAKSELLGLNQEIDSIDSQIKELYKALVESNIAAYNQRIDSYRDDLSKLDFAEQQYESPQSLRSIQNDRRKFFEMQLKYRKESIAYIEKELKFNKNLTAEYKAQLSETLMDQKSDMYSLQAQIIELNEAIVQSKIDETLKKYSDAVDKWNYYLNKNQLALEYLKAGTASWTKEMEAQINILEKKQKLNKQEISDLEKILKKEKLSSEQKESLTSTLNDLNVEYYQYLNNIKDLYSQMRDQQVEATTERINKLYDQQIEKQNKKLKQLDEQIEKEDRLKNLQEINDELAKTKSDKRFEYINEQGQIELTYDKEAVRELEKQRDELIKQYEEDDLRQSINDEIDRLEESRDKALKQISEWNENYRYYIGNNANQISSQYDAFVKLMDKLYKDHTSYATDYLAKTINTNDSITASYKKMFSEISGGSKLAELTVKLKENIKSSLSSNNFALNSLSVNPLSSIPSIVSKDNSSHTVFELNNVTIKADDPMGLVNQIKGLNFLIKSES